MKKVYIETYGCRMNLCDSEIILNILSGHGYEYTDVPIDADCVVINGCSVREIGHTKVFERIGELEKILNPEVILIIVGCIATQINESFFKLYPRVQLIVYPTAYKHIIESINILSQKQLKHLYVKGENVNEIYDKQFPLRLLEDKVTAAVTIMKGCDMNCSYCIEPYTRGGRVNRSYEGIMAEVRDIREKGYQEITLFGHIVDLWQGEHEGVAMNFAQLLSDIAASCPEQRIKFISSHPLTFTDEIARVMARHKNIMRVVHLPFQSGSDKILQMMNRKYTAEQFVNRVDSIRRIIPDINIVTDVIVGYPDEDEADFDATISVLTKMRFTNVNVFMFSMRRGTPTYLKYSDNVPVNVKANRRQIVLSLIDEIRRDAAFKLIGTKQHIIVESQCPNTSYWTGRDIYHRTVSFMPAPNMKVNIGGHYVVIIKREQSNNLYGELCHENTY